LRDLGMRGVVRRLDAAAKASSREPDPDPDTLAFRLGHAEIATNLASEVVVNLTVARNGRRPAF